MKPKDNPEQQSASAKTKAGITGRQSEVPPLNQRKPGPDRRQSVLDRRTGLERREKRWPNPATPAPSARVAERRDFHRS